MENDLKSIRLTLDYYDENGNHSFKDMSVKVNKPKDVSYHGYQNKRMKYAMTFSLVIPSHIHAYLLNKTVPVSEMSDRNGSREYASDFSKTLNSDSIEKLCDLYLRVVGDYVWLKGIDKAELQKVIFYKFNNSFSDFNSSWNGINLGFKSGLNYSYFIGYITTNTKTVLRYNKAKTLINTSYDRELYDYNYVNWTEDRQAFFENLQTSFENIISKVNAFNKNIDEESVDLAIKNNTMLKFIS